MADIKDTYNALAKFSGVWIAPETIALVGIEVTHPAFVEGVDVSPDSPDYENVIAFADPDRMTQAHPDPAMIASVARHGILQPIQVAKHGSRVLATNGRQRIMAARLANKALAAKGDEAAIRVPATPDKADDPLVSCVVTNEQITADTIPAKARKAQRMALRGYGDSDLMSFFRIKSALTLRNWETLLKVVPEILARIEAGSLPVSLGYELGKLPAHAQAAALAKIESEGGTMSGSAGRENVKAASEEPSGTGSGSRIRSKTKGLSKAALRQMAAAFSPAEGDDPYEILDFAAKLLAVIIGEDETGEGLDAWPMAQKIVARFARSGGAE